MFLLLKTSAYKRSYLWIDMIVFGVVILSILVSLRQVFLYTGFLFIYLCIVIPTSNTRIQILIPVDFMTLFVEFGRLFQLVFGVVEWQYIRQWVSLFGDSLKQKVFTSTCFYRRKVNDSFKVVKNVVRVTNVCFSSTLLGESISVFFCVLFLMLRFS